MDALFAKKNKKKGKKAASKKIDFNNQLLTGKAMDTEDPTERLQRLKVESQKKTSLIEQTTDSDWTETIEVRQRKKVINTAGAGGKLADLSDIAKEEEVQKQTLDQEETKNMFHWTIEQAKLKSKSKPAVVEAPAEPMRMTWRDRERMKREKGVAQKLDANDERSFPTLGGRPVEVAKKATTANNMWGQLSEDEDSSDEEEDKEKQEEGEQGEGEAEAAPADEAPAAEAPVAAAEELAPKEEEPKKEEAAAAPAVEGADDDANRFAGLKKKKKKKKDISSFSSS